VSIDVNELKARNDIVSVVGSYIALKKRGAEYVALCPFHDDKSPSLWVSPAKQFCHCFACDASHDVISFIQEMEGIDFLQACEKLGAEKKWEPKAPLQRPPPKPERITSKPPPDAPQPDFTLRALGEPELVFPIKDLDGALLGYECRYKGAEGKKEIRVWTWGSRAQDAPGWACGHFNVPRPLYGLPRLLERPDAPVSVFEGPKKAEAGKRLLPAYACLSWTGGAQAWHRHDWAPLAGRKILIWPDADEPGWTAAEKLAALLSDPRGLACSVRIVDTHGQPESWDVADCEADGWDTMQLVEWAKPRARDYMVPQAIQDDQLDNQSAPPDEESPPIEAYANEPEAQPKKRKPRLQVVGNTALSPEPDAEPLPAAMSEDALADHFAGEYGPRWRYVKAWGSWFEWRTDGWYKDDTALIDRLAVQTTRQALYWVDAQQLTPDGKRKLNSKRTAGNLRDIAMHDRRIAATIDQWDRHPMLLGVPGGVVDLRNGKLMPAQPELYITKRTSTAPEAGVCPVWLGLLERVTQGDGALLEYLQRLCGYVLTGETREECFAFIYGPAQTGKSTFIRVLQEILGDYHCKAQMETFTESRHERHAEELAVLVGSRLVTCTETEEGKRWNESRIKALTGRDRIRARFMRENSFEFDPQFKLIIAGNHAPHLRNVDDAMRRRLHVIPFTQPITMEERDDRLADKLRAEYPQILYWMIQGALAWQDAKLGRPDVIAQAVNNYLAGEDSIGEWIAECVELSGKCQTSGAYSNFKRWAELAGEYVMPQKRFVQALKERGFDTKRGAQGKRYITGLELKVDGPPYEGYDVP
jgi:putative DNA primase/helicase